MRLIAITDLDRASVEEHVIAYRELLCELGPEVIIQVRAPGRAARDLLSVASTLRDALAPLGARLVMNDRADIAKLCGLAGVHLTEKSMTAGDARAVLGPAALITRACHDVGRGAALSREDPADALLLSPVFDTPGKARQLGLAAIAELRAALPDVPVIALGGVTGENARACLDAGASGVACIRAALDAGARALLVRALRR